jgi:hypothetical protein
MKWITRSHVHVDRVACPWLITRFIDNQAEFLFVPKSQVDQVAQETGAIPFDAPGVELGHHAGRCSFESIILKYGLNEPGLLQLARIVHAADVAEDIDTDPLAAAWNHRTGFSLYPDDEKTCCPVRSTTPCTPGAGWRARASDHNHFHSLPIMDPHSTVVAGPIHESY